MPLAATPANLDALREMLSEQIPPGGTDADTLFSQAELTDLLSVVDYIETAASEGWSRKAGRLVTNQDGITAITAGTEKFNFVDPIKLAEHARQQAEMYAQRAPTGGAQLVAIVQPEVIATAPYGWSDISRLEGDPAGWL